MVPPRVCAAVTAIAFAAAPGSARAAPLSEDFDPVGPGWEATGLWHVQQRPESVSVSPAIAGVLTGVPAGVTLPAAFNGTGVAWFGDASTGTYCIGFALVVQHPSDGCRSNIPVTGTLTSPAFAVVSVPAAVRFRAWWEIAAADFETSDLMTVEYSADGGATWTEAARLNPVGPPVGALHQSYTSGGLRQPGVWREYAADISPAAGSADARVRFSFNSVDTLGQGFRGLLIDAVRVDGSEARGPGGGGTGAAGTAGAGLGPGGQSQPPAPTAAPVLARTIVIEPVSGTATYTVPGGRALTLVRPTAVPVGTVVDSRDGAVRVTAADVAGATQTGVFHDGEFVIRQQASDGVVELALRGGRFPRCEAACTAVLRTVRRLWGTATGRFRTRGRYASATIRGTNWLVEDHPGDTLVFARRDSLLVRDFIRDRDVVLNEGQRYVARAVFTNRQRGNPRFGQRYTLRFRDGRLVHVYEKQRVIVRRA
jgi:hypothetical protein